MNSFPWPHHSEQYFQSVLYPLLQQQAYSNADHQISNQIMLGMIMDASGNFPNLFPTQLALYGMPQFPMIQQGIQPLWCQSTVMNSCFSERLRAPHLLPPTIRPEVVHTVNGVFLSNANSLDTSGIDFLAAAAEAADGSTPSDSVKRNTTERTNLASHVPHSVSTFAKGSPSLVAPSAGVDFGRAALQRRRTISKVSTPQYSKHVSRNARAAYRFTQPALPAHNNPIGDVRDASLSRGKVPVQVVEEQRFSQFVGVCWNRRAKKWAAQSRVDGRTIYLGYFSDEKEAARKYDEHAAAIGRPVNFPLPGQGQALKVRLGAAIKRSFKRFSAEKERSPGKKSSTDIVTLNAPELVRTSTSSSTSSANNPVVSQLLPPAAVTCEHVDNENIIDKPSFST